MCQGTGRPHLFGHFGYQGIATTTANNSDAGFFAGGVVVIHVGLGVLGYLLGSIPFGYLIGRYHGIDVRLVGSGATGGTNVLRSVGRGAAIATGLGDLLKGMLAAWIGMRLGGEWGYAVATLTSMVGHSYPVWLGFRGGKSIATGAGALLLTYPWLVLIALGAAVMAIWPTRWVSLGSLTATTVLCGSLLALGTPSDRFLAAGAFLLIVWRHRSNIARMVAGNENRVGQRIARTGTDN